MKRTVCPWGLGIYSVRQLIYLFSRSLDQKLSTFCINVSSNGYDFDPVAGEPEIVDERGKRQNIGYCSNFRISQTNGKFFLSYKYQSRTIAHLSSAVSEDLIHWHQGRATAMKEAGMVVPNFKYKGKYLMYLGEDKIKLATSSDLVNWSVTKKAVLAPRERQFDSGALTVGTALLTDRGIVLLYMVKDIYRGATGYSLGVAIFDRDHPEQLFWRSDGPLLEDIAGLNGKRATLVGIIERSGTLISYWNIEGAGIAAISHPQVAAETGVKPSGIKHALKKLQQNPILKPIASHFWESKATFNPAAVYEDGKVHLIYRAVGDSDVSVLGYAASHDGVTFDERSQAPIYVPTQPFEISRPGAPVFISPYASGGGGYGGTEDPRLTKIDGKMYMTYVAYNGADPPRVALTSISEDDFKNQRWERWKKPVLISPPGVVDKNACILPEKINNQYVIFHRIYPNILIDFVDSLDFDGKTWLKGEFSIGPQPDSWDSRKVGIGPPPLKTKYGWLLIYHAVGEKDPSRYKMGAMLLDRDNPTRVLYRSRYPILEPEQRYENEGMKYGVAYPCGAVTMGDTLMVYYGGADMVVCAAQAKLSEFLTQLRHHEQAQLSPVSLQLRVN